MRFIVPGHPVSSASIEPVWMHRILHLRVTRHYISSFVGSRRYSYGLNVVVWNAANGNVQPALTEPDISTDRSKFRVEISRGIESRIDGSILSGCSSKLEKFIEDFLDFYKYFRLQDLWNYRSFLATVNYVHVYVHERNWNSSYIWQRATECGSRNKRRWNIVLKLQFNIGLATK